MDKLIESLSNINVRKNDGYIKVGPGTEKGSVFEIYLGKGV